MQNGNRLRENFPKRLKLKNILKKCKKDLHLYTSCAIITAYAVFPQRQDGPLQMLCTNIRDFKEEPNNGFDSGFYK